MKYELAVFDMDGTILDTLEDLKNSLNFALKENGFPERTTDEVRRFVGNGVRKLIDRAAPENTDKETKDKIFDTFNEHYKVHCTDNTRPYEGIKEAVKTLRDKGLKTAVVSNKEHYGVILLCEKYFPGLFDMAAGSTDAVRKKPAPDTVLSVMEKLGVPPEKTVYIGDSDVDIETAKNAGTDCISVSWGFRTEEFLKEHGATVITDKPEKLESLILQ